MSAPEVVAPDRGAPPVQVAAPSRALPPFDGPAPGLPPRTGGGRADRWRLAWPILACTAALPLAFAFGLQGAVWTLPALVLGLRLLLVRRPLADDLRVPGAAWALAAFLVVAALGVFQDAGTGREEKYSRRRGESFQEAFTGFAPTSFFPLDGCID
jgi:hypothetical protein